MTSEQNKDGYAILIQEVDELLSMLEKDVLKLEEYNERQDRKKRGKKDRTRESSRSKPKTLLLKGPDSDHPKEKSIKSRRSETNQRPVKRGSIIRKARKLPRGKQN